MSCNWRLAYMVSSTVPRQVGRGHPPRRSGRGGDRLGRWYRVLPQLAQGTSPPGRSSHADPHVTRSARSRRKHKRVDGPARGEKKVDGAGDGKSRLRAGRDFRPGGRLFEQSVVRDPHRPSCDQLIRNHPTGHGFGILASGISVSQSAYACAGSSVSSETDAPYRAAASLTL